MIRVAGSGAESPRVAIVAAPELGPRFPSGPGWPGCRHVALAPGELRVAVDRARALGADLSVVVDPDELAGEELERLPGRRIGMVTQPPATAEAVARLCALARTGALHQFTWFEEPPAEARGLPLLQVLPQTVDVARCPPAPALDARRVLVPGWARPPRACLARLRAAAEVVELDPGANPATWWGQLRQAGALAYWSRAVLGRLDPLPLLALAHGLLVVSSSAFAEAWGVERDDEYLLVPSADAMAAAVEQAARSPDQARAVRARAWQKVREAFAAEGAFRRLAHDALWLHASPEPVDR